MQILVVTSTAHVFHTQGVPYTDTLQVFPAENTAWAVLSES
jgi:hypothetical protein